MCAHRFDESEFILRFPTTDNIMHDIQNTGKFPVLFKIDVARASHNLRVDLADGLKFGIKWQNSSYLDCTIAFGWAHRSASFQISSDAVAYIMQQQGVKLYCDIDDYIAVIPTNKSEFAFSTLCRVWNELGLPINKDYPPPARVFVNHILALFSITTNP